jgi:hypothetical protein
MNSSRSRTSFDRCVRALVVETTNMETMLKDINNLLKGTGECAIITPTEEDRYDAYIYLWLEKDRYLPGNYVWPKEQGYLSPDNLARMFYTCGAKHVRIDHTLYCDWDDFREGIDTHRTIGLCVTFSILKDETAIHCTETPVTIARD